MVARFAWSELFAVGHDRLDGQHRHLVDLIARFCTSVHASEDLLTLKSLLTAIKRATREHLRSENAVLRELKAKARSSGPERRSVPRHLAAATDAAIEDHIAEHRNMMRRLTTIADRVDTIPRSDRPTLCADVKAWFLDHAVKHDAHLKTIFQAL